MSALIYRAKDGSLKVGDDSNGSQLSTAVYRATSDKRIELRNGIFVEVSPVENSERNLFRAE